MAVQRTMLGRRLLTLALTGIALLMVLVPIYWLVSSSVKLERDLRAWPPVIIPRTITLENYLQIFNQEGVLRALANSLVVSAGTTVISVLLGAMAAFVLARLRMPRRIGAIIAFWFLLTRMYPAISTALPLFLLFRRLGLIDTQVALITAYTSYNLPLVVWLLLGFFREIPRELDEAALVDGCTLWQRFARVVLPVSAPGVVAAAVLVFVFAWNEFLYAVILSLNNAKTLPVVLASYIQDKGMEWGSMTSLGVVMIAPVLVLVWAIQRHLVRGLTMGAVKG